MMLVERKIETLLMYAPSVTFGFIRIVLLPHPPLLFRVITLTLSVSSIYPILTCIAILTEPAKSAAGSYKESTGLAILVSNMLIFCAHEMC